MAITKTNNPPMAHSRRIEIEVTTQTLRLLDDQSVVAQFPVSTSRFGLGFEVGSLRTPTGRFVMREKIGEGAPAWTIFRARKSLGITAAPGGEEDQVLTRILTLDGLDPANGNTLERFIYIHGTNQEDLIGTTASHGCVRLRNHEMIALHDMVTPGMPVDILPPPEVLAKKNTR